VRIWSDCQPRLTSLTAGGRLRGRAPPRGDSRTAVGGCHSPRRRRDLRATVDRAGDRRPGQVGRAGRLLVRLYRMHSVVQSCLTAGSSAHLGKRVGARGGGSVGRDPVVDFDVVGSSVESEAGEGTEASAEGFVVGSDQDEVEVRHADVVGPDVNLFHALNATAEHLSYTHGLEGAAPCVPLAYRDYGDARGEGSPRRGETVRKPPHERARSPPTGPAAPTSIPNRRAAASPIRGTVERRCGRSPGRGQ
jgi:hypothetical protein